MKTNNLELRFLFFLGMIILPSLSLIADDPPTVEIMVLPDGNNPSEEILNLFVFLNTTTGQIYVETDVNQWLWVYIINTDTNAVFFYDVIDPANTNGNTYHTNAPAVPGNYCIFFSSISAEAYGYFSIH